MSGDGVLTVAGMARELGFSRRTVYRWIEHGKGPRTFKSPGGSIRINRSDFIEWVRSNQLDGRNRG
ncbi:helix-turn-helix domain-containing protein [Nocardiopsis chromatogenes]|uniref:helix-turn-helix domain-containing protein n=1 Tax=Nocardiopsis chromatogenes TaxID=280239 RepID=UPI0009FC1353